MRPAICIPKRNVADVDWPAAGLVDTELSYSYLAFKVHGAEISQCRVSAPRILEALDVVKHIGLGIVAGMVDLSGCPFGFER